MANLLERAIDCDDGDDAAKMILGGYRVGVTEDQLKGAPKYNRNSEWDWSDRSRDKVSPTIIVHRCGMLDVIRRTTIVPVHGLHPRASRQSENRQGARRGRGLSGPALASRYFPDGAAPARRSSSFSRRSISTNAWIRSLTSLSTSRPPSAMLAWRRRSVTS
jgi:hypothetical protein